MIQLFELLSDDNPTPSSAAARGEAIRAVQIAIATLPDAQREAVTCHYLNGKTVSETAARLRRSPGAVRGLLIRATRKMRHSLQSSSRWFNKQRH
jgi:RNA polymerase sigma factor (sigma-70 family)